MSVTDGQGESTKSLEKKIKITQAQIASWLNTKERCQLLIELIKLEG